MVEIQQRTTCFHCNQECEEDVLWLEDKIFCCSGCQTVYEILNENNLCHYYTLDKNPGISPRKKQQNDFLYLDEPAISKKLLSFHSENYAKVSFYIPSIHCISCIWLLENLKKLVPGVLRSEVNFIRKSVNIDFDLQKTTLASIAKVLASIGYSPQINLETEPVGIVKDDRSLIIKLAIAGFAFGNVMLFSFPEYLGLEQGEGRLLKIFSWLSLVLSWPVFFYSGADYLKSALKSFQQKRINIDVPIAAGLIALFLRSHYDIITASGPGYLDSLTGLVFFLLIGRWFQSKTYESLSYERDYKSYFPLAVNKLIGEVWKPVVIYELNKGDTIQIRNMEIIPADCELLDNEALLDYSFVTGESKPVLALPGSVVYAGGRLIGQPVVLKVIEKTSQSHLTSLWNNQAFRKEDENQYQNLIDKTARIFTWVILGISAVTGFYWYWTQPEEMWLVVTSVLMVACPCALALAAPFTYGTMLRFFGRHKLYLKNSDVIERIAAVDAIVFDKTGTVTYNQQSEVKFFGDLNAHELSWIKTLTAGSTHPLSKLITNHIASEISEIESFKELPGRGIEGIVQGHRLKIGNAIFTGSPPVERENASVVFISIDDTPRGYFYVSLNLRKDLKPMITRLGKKSAALLSGDNKTEQSKMKLLFGSNTQLLFNQDPHDKLNFIKKLQNSGRKVLMVGDGLNDSGALKQADVGIAVTDDTGIFTPASDGIIQGNQLENLDKILSLSNSATTIVKAGFAISFLYNAAALSFAVTGHLTPIIAAILMPLSSISVVAFSSLSVEWIAKQKLSKP